MSELSYLESVILGAIQGLTEFLPVSSSAHLALVQGWMGLHPDSLSMHVLDGIVHIGTTIAVFIVFAASFSDYVVRLAAELRGNWQGRRHALRFTLLGAAAVIPTGFIGLTFKRQFERLFGEPYWIGVGLLITGAVLFATAWVPRGRRGWKSFRWWQAAIIGTAQGVAITPGISRSGSTICAATMCGLRRRWAAEFSFFIAIPAILGATALKLREALTEHSDTAIAWGPTFAAGAVSIVVGVFALKLLLSAVRRAKLHYFAWYCWLLGGLVIVGLI